MTTSDTYLPAPPQTGRSVAQADLPDAHQGLWSQLLATFRDIGGAFDPFANDADAEVRALGRLARQRRPPRANDYFAIGDLCARMTLQNGSLSGTYAAKALAAYTRAAVVDAHEARASRAALLAFAFWVAEAACTLGNYEALKVGLLVCERVRQLDVVSATSADALRLQQDEQRVRDQLTRIFEDDQSAATRHVAVERESRLLCDQGQMLLRQNQAVEALSCFDRAIEADAENHAAWLWRAMALTDLGRFDAALTSYDRALAIEPQSAGMWNSKGALLLELGRLDEALAAFDRALDLSAHVSTVKAVYFLNRGKALYMLGRYQEARDALVRSNQLDPSPESAAGIAACHEQLKRS